VTRVLTACAYVDDSDPNRVTVLTESHWIE
jgi:hypothetical protein